MGKGFTLTEGRVRLDVRKKFFIVRVVRRWTKLPKEVVAASSLEMLKAGLDGPFGSKGRCPYPWQGVEMRRFLSSLPNHSMLSAIM